MRTARWSLGLAIALSLAAVGYWRLKEHRQTEDAPLLTSSPSAPSSGSAPAAPAAPPAVPVDPYAATDARRPLEPPTLDGTATVRVRILSARGGEPLAGAIAGIVIPSERPSPALMSATSDASGIVTFTAARPGIFAVCAHGPGHAQACEKNVGVVAGGALSVELRLPPGATLVGSVQRTDGTPAAGIRLVAQGDGFIPDVMLLEALTDAQGAFRLEGMTPGGWYSVIPHTPEGPATRREVAELKAGEVSRLDIPDLGGFVPLTVTPVWTRDKRRNATVEVEVGGVPLTAQPDGTYQGMVEAGTQIIQARDSLDRVAHQKVTLSAGKPKRVKVTMVRSKSMAGMVVFRELTIPEPFELAGHVLLADGTPVKRLHVSFEEPPRYAMKCGNVPRHFSHFRFEGSAFVLKPPGGTRTLYAWLEDGRLGSLTLTGSPGQRVVANITLKETGAVVGRLPKEWGSWPTDISVDNRWVAPFHLTAADGSFLIAGLEPGEHVFGHGKLPFTVRARERTDLGLLPLPKAP